MGDMAHWLECRHLSLKTGFDRLVGQGEAQIFLYPSESTLVQTCLCQPPHTHTLPLPPPPPPPPMFACTARNLCTFKITYPSVVKELVVWSYKNTAYTRLVMN